jgi:hypothetical protein
VFSAGFIDFVPFWCVNVAIPPISTPWLHTTDRQLEAQPVPLDMVYNSLISELLNGLLIVMLQLCMTRFWINWMTFFLLQDLRHSSWISSRLFRLHIVITWLISLQNFSFIQWRFIHPWHGYLSNFFWFSIDFIQGAQACRSNYKNSGLDSKMR